MGRRKINIAYMVLLAATAGGIIMSYILKDSVDIHIGDTMVVLNTSFFWKILLLYNLLLFANNHFLVKVKGRVGIFQWIFYFAAVVFTTLICFSTGFLNKPGGFLNHASFKTFEDIRFYNELVVWLTVVLLAFHALCWLYSIVAIFRCLVLKKIMR